MKMFVIGNENCVLGFALAGVGGRVVHSAQQVEQALSQCLSGKTIGLVLVASDVADLLRSRIDRLKVESLSPLVVEIPGPGEDSSYPSLKDLVQGAIGISLGGE